jgi:membrane-associated protein
LIETAIELLESLMTSPWFLPLVFTITLLDAVVPVVPSETAMIIGGIAAGFGHFPVVAVIVCGALGAMSGDSIAYQIGSSFEGPLRRRASPRMLARLEWAKQALARRAGVFIITARFIPGGRTAITLGSGITRLQRRRFTGFVAIAGVLWATYSALLGFFFGNRFQDDHQRAFLYAFGTALTVLLSAELIRFILSRRRRHANGRAS